MSVDERQIQENCQDLWQTALGLGLEQPAEVPISEESSLSSYVNVNGEWQGAVILECPESIVRHAAAMLYASDLDDMTDQDLQGALNELTRMLGKNLQKQLAENGKVSAPRPIRDGEVPEALTTMQVVSELTLSCEGRPVRISVLERLPAAATATATEATAIRA